MTGFKRYQLCFYAKGTFGPFPIYRDVIERNKKAALARAAEIAQDYNYRFKCMVIL